jgi:hypothetical protein
MVTPTTKIDTGLELKTGTADRALAEVMRELSQIAVGGTMANMQRVITTHFPTSSQEVEKFVNTLERLRRAAESTFQTVIGEQHARRSKG